MHNLGVICKRGSRRVPTNSFIRVIGDVLFFYLYFVVIWSFFPLFLLLRPTARRRTVPSQLGGRRSVPLCSVPMLGAGRGATDGHPRTATAARTDCATAPSSSGLGPTRHMRRGGGGKSSLGPAWQTSGQEPSSGARRKQPKPRPSLNAPSPKQALRLS